MNLFFKLTLVVFLSVACSNPKQEDATNVVQLEEELKIETPKEIPTLPNQISLPPHIEKVLNKVKKFDNAEELELLLSKASPCGSEEVWNTLTELPQNELEAFSVHAEVNIYAIGKYITANGYTIVVFLTQGHFDYYDVVVINPEGKFYNNSAIVGGTGSAARGVAVGCSVLTSFKISETDINYTSEDTIGDTPKEDSGKIVFSELEYENFN